MTIVLASTSPRRRELLARLPVTFQVIPSLVAEREPRAGDEPCEYALELARAKAHAVATSCPDSIVLAADTAVATPHEIFGKPTDETDAVRMLRALRGRDHIVCTAVVVRRGEIERRGSVCAVVRMREYSEEEISRYASTGEPLDKAGGYAIQGQGGALVAGVRGCMTTIIGLPLCLAGRLLEEFGMQVNVDPEHICDHRNDLTD